MLTFDALRERALSDLDRLGPQPHWLWLRFIHRRRAAEIGRRFFRAVWLSADQGDAACMGCLHGELRSMASITPDEVDAYAKQIDWYWTESLRSTGETEHGLP